MPRRLLLGSFEVGPPLAYFRVTGQFHTADFGYELRLLSDVQLEGRIIPRNSFLYGTCQVSGNRLTIEATSVQIQNCFP